MAKKLTTPSPRGYVPPPCKPLNRLAQPSAGPHAQGTRRQRSRQAREAAALQHEQASL